MRKNPIAQSSLSKNWTRDTILLKLQDEKIDNAVSYFWRTDLIQLVFRVK